MSAVFIIIRTTHTQMTKCGSFLRGIDNFGSSISPTYKGNRQFKTPIGGLFTVLMLLVLLAIVISGTITALFGEDRFTNTAFSTYFRNNSKQGVFNVSTGSLNLAASLF